MRFEVPQFIEVEDKIIGPFTWRQFIYLAGGGGAAVVLFFVLPLFLFVLTGVPIMILAGFLAFHKVNNRPFSSFLESGFNYATRNRLYLWRKRNEQSVLAKTPPPEETVPIAVTQPVAPAPQMSQNAGTHLPSPETNNITKLSRKLELEALQINDGSDE